MIELLSPAQMAEADRLTIAAGVAGTMLMENAGRAVADAASRMIGSGAADIRIVAGPGNNGGDGFVAARLLAERGMPVEVLLVGERSALKSDAALAAQRWSGQTKPASPEALAGATIVIDALFGAGLDRPVTGLPRAMIDAINHSGARVLAVDLPSGINGASGAVMGAAVHASDTVTFFRRKPGHLLLPGRLACGVIQVAQIGIAASVLDRLSPRVFANAPPLWARHFPWPKADGHKYDRGHAVVMSGGMTATGAARLAARGALRAGAGLVTLASPKCAVAVNAAASLAVMVQPVEDAAAFEAYLADPRLNCVVLGPGGGVGERMRDFVGVALSGSRTVVLDADALTSFADDPGALFSRIKSTATREVVLTPHQGEFSRLFKMIQQEPEEKSKIQKASAAAAVSGAVVILKGADTVVAAPDGRMSIAENAPPWLATAGSGDVLAGFVGGLLSQGMPAFEAASAAVWLHGEAAAELGPGLISEDLPEALPKVYRRLYSEVCNAGKA